MHVFYSLLKEQLFIISNIKCLEHCKTSRALQPSFKLIIEFVSPINLMIKLKLKCVRNVYEIYLQINDMKLTK
jgi:hypothetical protein